MTLPPSPPHPPHTVAPQISHLQQQLSDLELELKASSSHLYPAHLLTRPATVTPSLHTPVQISHLQQQLSHLELELEGERASSSQLQSQLSSALNRSSDREQEAQGVVRRWEEERGALQGQLRELQRQLTAAREEAAKQVCTGLWGGGGRDKQRVLSIRGPCSGGSSAAFVMCCIFSQKPPDHMHVVLEPIAGAGCQVPPVDVPAGHFRASGAAALAPAHAFHTFHTCRPTLCQRLGRAQHTLACSKCGGIRCR